MSMTVGELRAILTVDTEGFDRGVKRVHGELGETEKKSTRMGRSLRKVGGYAAAAFGGYQVLKFGKDIAQTAADTQNARLVLQGLYGDAHLADTTFAKLKQVAKGSPIDRSEYLKSADSLAYLGVKGDDAVTMIKRMTQAAIGSGRGREGVDQMIQGLTRLSSQGKATADVVDQISQGGFALWSALAKHMHMTIPQVHKAVSAGKVGMKQITDTIEHENNKWTRATARSAAKAEGSLKNRFAAAKNEVTDSIADMVEPLLVKLAPAVTAVANDLQGFVGFLTRHKTTVEGVAVGLGVLATEILAVKTATMIYNTRASLVRDATKKWAAAQRLLNLAMDANPMMLVISVVAMLVAAFITAYTTSKTFRKIVNGAFGAVASFVTGAISTVRKVVVGGFNWIKNHLGIILPIIAGIVFGPVGAIAVFIATHWSQIKRITGKVFGWVRDFIGTALGKAKSVALGAVRWIVDKFLWFAEKIVGAAARAFGWVPGLGGKLKSAERAIHAFRAKTNAELRAVDSTPAQREMHSLQRAIDHLRGRNINIRAHVGGGGVLRTLAKARQLALPKASGGSVQGPGTETSDSIPALLSRGEHVWSAREVRGAGGHAAVEAMRRHARGLASGGPVGVNVNMPSPHALTTEWARMVGSISHRLMDTLGSALSKAMSMFGGAGGPGPTSHGATVALGRRMAAAYGWTGGQWTALNKLWTRESSWNPHARNPSSGVRHSAVASRVEDGTGGAGGQRCGADPLGIGLHPSPVRQPGPGVGA
jgi:tape measure domain-containing protein